MKRFIKNRDIDAATNTCGIPAVPEVIEADAYDADTLGDYYTALVDRVTDDVGHECDSLIFDIDDNNIYATIGYDDHVWELKIPFEDLTLNIDELEKDVAYVGNSVIATIDEGLDSDQ